VDYVFGKAPNSAYIWLIGNDPDLFDYFLPDRWRRTPRVRLSPISNIYRTRTRDNVHVIYRKSRVGEKPYVDPYYEPDRRIRKLGFNSPFEEVAIAEQLRALGMHTVYPRVIYRTGHESVNAVYMFDDRRYKEFEHLKTPGAKPEPILSPNHDYFTVWGYWRGIDSLAHYSEDHHWGLIDVHQARDDGILTERQSQDVVALTVRRLDAVGLAGYVTNDHELLLRFKPDGTALRTDAEGNLEVTLAVNALSAFDVGLLTEAQYRELIEHQTDRLTGLGFEPLHLRGHHLLLAIHPDGTIKKDNHGQIDATLCNFELIQMRDRSTLTSLESAAK